MLPADRRVPGLHGDSCCTRPCFFLPAAQPHSDVTANNTAFDFFTNRTQISGVMEFRLNQELSSVHGSVDAFQLLDIAFPEQFESARIRQETATQVCALRVQLHLGRGGPPPLLAHAAAPATCLGCLSGD